MRRQVREALWLLGVALVAFAVLAVPLAVRVSFFDTFPGSVSHYHARAAESLGTGSRTDEGSFETRVFFYTPYHYLLHYFHSLMGLKAASLLLPFALGIVGAAAFFHLLRRLGVPLGRSGLATLLLLLWPAFLYTFTNSDIHALGAVLFVLALSFSFQRGRLGSMLSFACLLLMSYLSTFNALLVAFVSLYFAIAERRVLQLALLLAASVPYYALYFSQNALPLSGLSLPNLLSDLGGYGLGFFNVLLIVIGAGVLWHERKSFSLLYLLLIFLSVSSVFMEGGVVYLGVIGAVFAAEAAAWLYRKQWEISLLKSLTLIAMICGLTFSTLTYLQRNFTAEPSLYLSEALSKLKPLPEGYVLSSRENGFWIEYLADKPVLQDTLTRNRKIGEDAEALFSSRNLPRARALLSNYSVRYILIDKRMRDAVFSRQEGLVFLLRNNETFKNVFSNQQVAVWEVR